MGIRDGIGKTLHKNHVLTMFYFIYNLSVVDLNTRVHNSGHILETHGMCRV